jgi:hypothetical protein
MKNGKQADQRARRPDAEDAGQRAGDDEELSSRVVESGDDDEEEEEDEEGEGAYAGYVDDLDEVRVGSSVGVQCVQAPGCVVCACSRILMLVVLANCLRPRHRRFSHVLARRSARATRIRPATPPSWSGAAAAARNEKSRSRPPGCPPPTSASMGARQKSTQRWRHERCRWSRGSMLSAPRICICMHICNICLFNIRRCVCKCTCICKRNGA